MRSNDAASYIISALSVTREDIARAKGWLLKSQGDRPNEMVEQWLDQQKLDVPKTLDLNSPDIEDRLAQAARAFGVRLAFYQAIWELVGAAELIAAEQPTRWHASITGKEGGHSGGLPLDKITCSYPARIEHSPYDFGRRISADIFLDGVECKVLHAGIVEAIDQSLTCFARGLYMPATAMLAAAAEATWTECGEAVAKKLTNTKLAATMNNLMVSISKKVVEIRKALEHPDGKQLVRDAGQSITKVNDADRARAYQSC